MENHKKKWLRYGVTQQIWSRWETGVRTPRIENMKRLEDDIGIPMEVIFADVFNKPNYKQADWN